MNELAVVTSTAGSRYPHEREGKIEPVLERLWGAERSWPGADPYEDLDKPARS
jgi:hypothetical protein